MRVCCSFAMPRWLFAEKVLDVSVKLAGCRIENSIDCAVRSGRSIILMLWFLGGVVTNLLLVRRVSRSHRCDYITDIRNAMRC